MLHLSRIHKCHGQREDQFQLILENPLEDAEAAVAHIICVLFGFQTS